MNILDLNEDIMSKIKHNLFLKSLMKHQKEFDYNEYIDWKDWEDEKYIDCISVEGIRVLLGHPAQNHTKNQGYTLVIFPKYTKNARIFLKTAYLE